MIEIPPNEVHVWYTRLDQLSPRTAQEEYEPLLSDDERMRAERFVFARDRHRHVVTRALVRTTLSRYWPTPPAAWLFRPSSAGRPMLVGPAPLPPLQFNVSHTARVTACAVARDCQLGIDVEDLDREVAVEQLARRYFAPTEAAALEALPAARRQEAFFDYWTLKEAYLKARGLGLALPLDGLAIERGTQGGIRISFAASMGDDPLQWQFRAFDLEPRHRLAVAVGSAGGGSVSLVVRQTVPPREGRVRGK